MYNIIIEDVRFALYDSDPDHAEMVQATAQVIGHDVIVVAHDKAQLYEAIVRARENEDEIDMFLCNSNSATEKDARRMRALGLLVVCYEQEEAASSLPLMPPSRSILEMFADISDHHEVRPRILKKHQK